MPSLCLPRKVDDDVVYIAEHAIAELVRERLRKRCLLVSANAWNSLEGGGSGFQSQILNAGAQVVNHAIMSAPRLAFLRVGLCNARHSSCSLCRHVSTK